MKPRPLIKWKSFWLGILVLVFLGWSWARSMQRISLVTWTANNGVRQVQISQYDATLNLWSGDSGFIREPGFDFETRSLSRDERSDWFPNAFRWENDEFGKGLFVAHWFLLLLFLVPCVGFLAWRVRKQRKHVS